MANDSEWDSFPTVDDNSEWDSFPTVDEDLYSKYAPKPKPETMGWRGIGEDALSGAKEIYPGLKNAFKSAPREIYGAGKQIFTDPIRAATNLEQGLVNLMEGSFNLSPNIINYLGKKGIVDPNILNGYKGISHTNLHKLLGRSEDPQAGDALLSAIMEYGGTNALARIGTNAASSTIRKAAQTAGAHGLHAAGQNRNPVTEGLAAGLGSLAGSGLKAGWDKVVPNVDKISAQLGEIEPNKVRTEFKTIFNDFDKKVGNSGASHTPNASKMTLKDLKELGSYSKEVSRPFKKYLKNKTYSNAHKLQSAAGKIIRRMERQEAKGNFPDSSKTILDAANKIKDKSKFNIKTGFENSGNSHLVGEYNNILGDYGKRAVPLIYNPHVIKFQEMLKAAKNTGTGDLSVAKRKFVKALANDQNFQSNLGGKYKQPAKYKKFTNIVPNTLKAIGIGSGIQRMLD
jgi:hypothetical protein